MNEPESESAWYQQPERGSSLGMSIVVWVALRLGRPVVRLLLSIIVFYYTLFFPSARQASRRFLARCQQYPVKFWQVYRHFFYFAQVTVDRLYFLSGKTAGFSVDIEGREVIDEYLDSGRGCLLLMSHLGSFDVIRAMGRDQKNVRAVVLMDRDYAEKAMKLISAINPDMAADIVDVEQPPAQLMLRLQELLANGAMVGVMADRVHRSERVFSHQFMGDPVRLPAGLWQMAAALKIPVIACFGVYLGTFNGVARYEIHFEAVGDSSHLSRRERAGWIADAQQHYVQALESKARAFPYNWFNFYNYWMLDEIED